jgi:pimeloyl-ACP methyl ester carboxylesterase
MKRWLISLAALWLLWVSAVVALVAFGTAKPPPPLGSITDAFSTIDIGTLPALKHYRARDGVALSFRVYASAMGQAAVLIHGSAGSSGDMHPLALALQKAGIEVYVPDLRGHGANSPHGDVAYIGQLEDDLADFMASIKVDGPVKDWTLVGFSSGGGFALRIAATHPLGDAFSQVVLVSPYLKYSAPSIRKRPPSGVGDSPSTDPARQWAVPSIGRIIGLSTLNALHIHTWDRLPVIQFAVPHGEQTVTWWYSWRMVQNFAPHGDYLADIRAVRHPTMVLVGSSDEILDADALRSEFVRQNARIRVEILAGVGHSAMVTNAKAIEAIVTACTPEAHRRI